MARNTWHQVFSQVRRFDALAQQFPPPVWQSSATYLQGLPRNENEVMYAIGQLESHCPLTFPGDAEQIGTFRAELMARGQQWLANVTTSINGAEAFLSQQAAMSAAPLGQMNTELMSTFQRMNEQTTTTLQNLEASNRALWQRELLMLSGQPFYEVWPWSPR